MKKKDPSRGPRARIASETWRLTRSGGFDGRLREWPLGPGSLGARARAVLLRAQPAGSGQSPRSPARDMVQYRFTVTRGARRRTFLFDERTLPSALRVAVARITGEGSSLV